MPLELTTFLLAMLPIGELRIALPFGILAGLTPASAFFWATLGNVVAAIAVVFLLEPLILFSRKHFALLDRLLTKIFQKIRQRHSRRFNRFGAIMLVLLVAVPLPGSGGWTGALVAWLFGVPRRTAIFLISLGIIFAGLIVLGLTTGALTLAKLI